MPDIAPQIETALAVMRLFDQIKALLAEGVTAIRHYPNATEEEKTKLHMLSYQVGELHARLMAEEEREEEAEEGS
jgi:pyrroline-5-carboxylate reductase